MHGIFVNFLLLQDLIRVVILSLWKSPSKEQHFLGESNCLKKVSLLLTTDWEIPLIRTKQVCILLDLSIRKNVLTAWPQFRIDLKQ